MFIREKEGRQPVTVYLEDIAGKLEETMDHWEQYLNVATGEYEALPDGTYVDADEELVERIENSTDYARLPNQCEIHEYRIMERFTDTVLDQKKQATLFHALNGRRPYRQFKDELNCHGLTEAYYAFRFQELIRIAKEWCEDNRIPFQMREKQGGGH